MLSIDNILETNQMIHDNKLDDVWDDLEREIVF